MTITCLLTRHPARACFARGRSPDKSFSPGPPDTPAIDRQCLFPSKYHDASNEAGPEDITFEELQQALKTMAGTIVTPVDALMRFHHYTAHFPDDYDIDGVTVTALLTLSGAPATDISLFSTPFQTFLLLPFLLIEGGLYFDTALRNARV